MQSLNNLPKISISPSNKKTLLERQSTQSSMTSTITSSICSSITNITARSSPIHIKTSTFQLYSSDSNNKNTQSIDFDQTITIKDNDNSKLVKRTNMSQKSDTDVDDYFSSFNQQEQELFESDDILRILFKKTYFYQMKLK